MACTLINCLQLFVFYARFYCAITFGIMMVSKVGTCVGHSLNSWLLQIHQLIVPLLMLISLFWVPQIYEYICNGTSHAMLPSYIWGTTFCKLMPVLWVIGLPGSLGAILSRWESFISFFLILSLSIQATILHVLNEGELALATVCLRDVIAGLPNWMVPAVLRPLQHDYFIHQPFIVIICTVIF